MRMSLFVLLFLMGTALNAEVKVPSFFSDNMVLQRDREVKVWGWADKGEKVKVSFDGQSKSTTAGSDGKWMLKLDAMKANSKSQTLKIASKEFKNIVVGDVWLCSGQSNMEWTQNRSQNAKEEAAQANYPLIRHLKFGHTHLGKPQDDYKSDWKVCTPKSVGGFTAVGYFFARKIQQDLNVPIGLLGINWGGTRVEPWTTREAFAAVPELKQISDKLAQTPDDAPGKHQSPTRIYNAMINPVINYAIRGAIWYQGESNGGEGDSYFFKKKALIEGWRQKWGYEFPFYFVQLANFKKPTNTPAGGDGWAKLREAQRRTLTLAKTGMAVITDVGTPNNIHPPDKQDVGHRLAVWALNKEYGKTDVVHSGPLYKEMKVQSKQIVISFEAGTTGSGLMIGTKGTDASKFLEPVKETKDAKIMQFSIAGADKKWYWAEAKIVGKTIVVSSPEVKNPVAVRYAYRMNPVGANLYNKEGLPASPFRTDSW
jgi:sialate O-acetylesterase